MFPLMSLKDVEGALYLPSDGSARSLQFSRERFLTCQPVSVAQSPTHTTRVKSIEVRKRTRAKVWIPRKGRYPHRKIVVVATGIWSPRIGHMVGISIPLIPMQHQWVMTEPVSVTDANRNIRIYAIPISWSIFARMDKGWSSVAMSAIPLHLTLMPSPTTQIPQSTHSMMHVLRI